ncbi:MAG: type IV pilus secretin PilQ [Deltaproteobacteria bacterium]|nr:type IV pilus secretin PilQ [Deltaproteobacteria bacterium]MBN2672139.1 type IV pilus secretin PilQ [Deltaproteobacteria bacterium]
MNKSRITQTRMLKALFVALVVVVCAGTTTAAAPKKMNTIHAVDVSQRGGQTVITVKGSSRPMYTAFKLSTPKRLVLDLANSSLKGVPALLEKSTNLVGGVAVSEFTTGKVRVSRVMINFKKEASYRVKVKGNSLVVTLSGGPAAKEAAPEENAPGEQVISLANAEERIDAVQKSADERVQKAEKEAQKEVVQARLEAAAAKKEANNAKAEISKAQKEVEQAQAGASEAEVKWRMARAEINKLKAKQAHYDSKLEQAQKEADAAQKELVRLQRAQQQNSKDSNDTLSRFEADAARQIATLTRKVRDAQKAAEADQKERNRLEKRLSALKSELEQSKREAAAANRAKEAAQADVNVMKSSVREAFLEKEAAKKEAKSARDAQREAEAAYRAAGEKDRNALYSKLQQRQRETVEAKKRYASAEKQFAEIDEKLEQTMAALRVAEKQSKRAQQAKADAEKNAAKQQAAYEKQLATLSSEVARAESEARQAKLEKERAVASLETEKARVVRESEKLKKEAAAKMKAAEERVQRAEVAEKEAKSKTKGVMAKIHDVESRLQDANQTILSQKELIATLQKKADEAAEQAKAAEAEKENALRRAKDAAKQADAERASAEKRAEDARKEADAAILAQEKMAKQMSEKKGAAPEVSSESATAPKREKLTQEELRMQRLAQLQEKKNGKGAAVAAKVAPLAVESEPAVSEKGNENAANAIQDIKFVNKGASQKVVISGSGEFKYSKSEGNNRTVVMEFSDARLLPMLERTLDVRDFGGVISSISSYRENGKVKVEVKLGRFAKNKVSVRDGVIEWSFIDTQTETKETVQPLGSSTRVVHRENDESYGYPTERTAAYSVTLADLSQRKEKYTGRRIDLDFKSADIHNILRLLADVGHVNIITSNDVSGSVTIRMRDVPWDQALDVILQTKGLGKVRQGNLIRVAPLAVLEAEYEKAIERIKMSKELKPLETRLIPVSYATAGELMPRANDLLTDRGKLSVDNRTNVIIARDVPEVLDQIEALIRNLDTQTPQVLIEGRIVEATSTYAREIGIQWGGDFSASAATGNPTGLAFPSTVGVAGGATDSNAPLAGLTPVSGGQPNPNFAVNLPAATGTGSGGALGISLGSIANNANLNLRLSAMEEEGTLRILSSPKILTLDNREAHIEQGTMIPYSRVSASGVQTSFKEAKLNLTVTPHVTADGSILLAINMTRDEPDFNNKGARGDPTILKREAKTELLVNDGHTAVIGGIFTRNHGRSYKKVPFFGDIPILGWLFKSRSDSDRRSEMLIFITPTIVNRAESIGQ